MRLLEALQRGRGPLEQALVLGERGSERRGLVMEQVGGGRRELVRERRVAQLESRAARVSGERLERLCERFPVGFGGRGGGTNVVLGARDPLPRVRSALPHLLRGRARVARRPSELLDLRDRRPLRRLQQRQPLAVGRVELGLRGLELLGEPRGVRPHCRECLVRGALGLRRLPVLSHRRPEPLAAVGNRRAGVRAVGAAEELLDTFAHRLRGRERGLEIVELLEPLPHAPHQLVVDLGQRPGE